LEVRCLLSVSLGPSLLPLHPGDASGGPFPNQSQVWGGYSEAALLASEPSGSQYIIGGVPAYLWHDGCGPTSAGMIVGYWDMHGFPNLIPGDSSTETAAVDNAIASNEHYNDYSVPIDDESTGILPDKSSLGGAHANNCIADWMHTSWSSEGSYYGDSWFSDVPGAIVSYCTAEGYSGFTAKNEVWGDLTWDNFKAEIDAGHPVELLVDTTGSGTTDHFVPAIGYDDANHLYACYDTWDTQVHWYSFADMAPGQLWGIYGATIVDPPAVAPTVTTNPVSVTTDAGLATAITFTAAATGNPAPTVKWQVNTGSGFTDISDGGVYSGATTTTLTITGATRAMNGYQYQAVFTDGTAPDATTTAATLTVNPALGITPATLPAGVTNTPYHQTITVSGGTAPYTIFAVSGFSDGGTGLTGSQIVASATAGTIVIDGTPTAAGSATFAVNVTDGTGVTLSQGYTITVGVPGQPPVVTINPASATTDAGLPTTVSFTAAASGTPAPTVKWQVNTGTGFVDLSNGGVYSGATTTTLTITGATPDMNGDQYQAVFTDGTAPDATTTAATLTVNAGLGITPAVLPTGVAHIVYHQKITISGGTMPYTIFSVNGFSDGGSGLASSEITPDASSGTIVIDGTPTGSGTAIFGVNVIDSVGATLAANYTVTVGGLSQAPAVTTNPASVATDAGLATTVTFTAAASGTPTPTVRWQVDSGQGFTDLSNGGVYSGVTTGTLSITGATPDMNGDQYRAVFTNGTAPDATTTAARLTVSPALGLTPATLPAGSTNTLYQQTITVSGGTAPYTTFSVSGFSAGGTGLTSSALAADAKAETIVIDGTPTGPGSASFTVNVTDSAGATLSQSYAIAVNNVIQPPVVTAISPTSGSTDGGTTVTITGTGFTGATAVDFGGAAATFTVDSDTTISALSPLGTGTVDVTVKSANGTSATSAADQFTYVAAQAPTVTAISPTSGPPAGGTIVTLTGTGFTNAIGVDFGKTAALFDIISDTDMLALTPAGTGTVDVTVTTANGTSATSAADQFTYLAANAPTVTSLLPTSGSTAGGTLVSIIGTNLLDATAVAFGTTAVTNFVNDTADLIEVYSPAGAAGAIDVTVTTTNGTSATSTADQFTYVAAPQGPTVTAVSPTAGPTAGGTEVTITGTGFTGATAVHFGGTAATVFTIDSDTEIMATSPAGSAGMVDVTVIAANGMSALSSADQFTYVAAAAAPTVTAMNPTSGSTAGGTEVTITGTGFTAATAVNFGSTAATAFTVDSDTQIVATSPAGAAGTVDVMVTTAEGTSVASSADRFTYAAVTATAATVGLYDPTSSTFLLRNTNDSGPADEVCSYGAAKSGMVPIVGDWTGDGIQSIGLYDPTTSTFYLKDSNSTGYADTVFVFGPANAGDEPVVGNWDGVGGDGIGLYDPSTSTFYLRNTIGLQGPNDKGYADVVFSYGAPHSNMIPLAGDWDGSGRDGIGLYSPSTSTFYLREATQLQGPNDKGFADDTLNYGVGGKGFLPVVGDWNADGRDGIGLYDQATATFLLRNALQLQGPSDKGYADLVFMYGSAQGNQLPLAGVWTASSVVPLQSPDAGGTVTSTTGTLLSPAAISSISTFPTASVNVRVDATAQNVSGTNVAANGSVSGSATSSTNVVTTGSVNSRALDQIDLSTVAASELGHFGLSDPDALAGDIIGGVLNAGVRHNVS
jgi:hypothetical protein